MRVMRLKYKLFFSIFFALAVGPVLLWILGTAWLDPFSLISARCPEPNLPTIGQERFRNPGYAISYGQRFEGAIIGDSMTQNFHPRQIKEQLGYTPLKLCMAGSSMEENIKMCQLALRNNPQFKIVIWGIDLRMVVYPDERVRTPRLMTVRLDNNKITVSPAPSTSPRPFPDELYDENRWNDLTVYWSKSIIPFALEKIKKNPALDYDMISNWTETSKNLFTREHFLEATLATYLPTRLDYETEALTPGWFEQMTGCIDDYLEKDLKPLISAYPKTQFYLFIPPRSAIEYTLVPSVRKEYIKRLAALALELPNVQLFDFMQLREIVTDVSRYRDYAHHDEAVNNFMIECMARGQYRITPDNLTQSFATIDEYSTYTLKDLGYDAKIDSQIAQIIDQTVRAKQKTNNPNESVPQSEKTD